MANYDSAPVLKHLQEKWGNRVCPMCGVGSWNVQDSVFQLTEFNDGAVLVVGGPRIPVIPITCANCGNTILVNGITAGAVKHLKHPEPKK
jgi:hypothetical protein